MKKFIERTGFFGHRPIFFDKYAMVIGDCGGFGAKEVTKYLRDIFNSYGFNVVSSLELKFSTKSDREREYNKDLITKEYNNILNEMDQRKRITP